MDKNIPPKKRKEVSQVIDLVDDEDTSQKATKKPKPRAKRPYKKPAFRVDTLSFFLTVPQYKGRLTPKEVMEKIKEFCSKHEREVESIIVSLENHGVNKDEHAKGIEKTQDPGVHFHVVIKMLSRWNIKNPNWFDEIFGQHVHIESAKNHKAVVLYTAKDGNYVTHNLNIDAIRRSLGKKTGVKHEEVAMEIVKTPDIPLKTLIGKFPGYMLQHQKKVIDFASLCQTINVETTPYLGLNDYSHVNPQSKQICQWLEANLFPIKRLHKQKQLYIYGPTNIRKTTLLMKLMESFNTYIVAEEGNQLYWTTFHDGYELAIFDEFGGGKTVTQMNSFLEGAPIKLACKGGDAVLKKRNIPVIICSNRSPAEVYHNVAEKTPLLLDALLTRLLVVDCSNFMDGDYIDIPFKQAPIIEKQVPIIENVIDLEKSNDALTIPNEFLMEDLIEPRSELSDCACSDDDQSSENISN